MNRTRILSILGTVAGGAVALVGGIALGDALSDDPTLPSATPAEAAPPAILAPDDLVVTDADGEPVDDGSALDLGPEGTPPPRAAGILPQPPGPGERTPDAEALLALADDTVAQAAAVAAGEAEPEAFEPPTDESGVVEDSPAALTPTPEELAGIDGGVPEAPDFVDICAGPTPGDVPPEDLACPEAGVAGTVLALTSDPTAGFDVDLAFLRIATGSEAMRFHNPGQVNWGYCDFGEVAPGRVPVIVILNRPADVVIEHGAPGSPEGTVEVSPPPGRLEVVRLEVEARGSDTDVRLLRTQVCADVPRTDGPELELTITATDITGARISHTLRGPVGGQDLDFSEPEPRPVPPPPPPPKREAELHAIDDRVIRIIAPHDDPRRERVFIATVQVSGPDGGAETCGSIQQSVFEGTRRDPHLFNWDVTPRISVPDFDFLEQLEEMLGREPEEDPNEGLRFQTVTLMSAQDGEVYDVCVWWTGNPSSQSQFATRPIVEQRRYRVSAPDRYQVEVVIEDLALWQGVEANQFTAEILGNRVSFPSTDLPGSVRADGESPPTLDQPILLARTADGDTPLMSELFFRNEADGSSWAVMIGTRTRACDGTDEGICISGVSTSRLVELPMGSAQAVRCLGNGCPDGPGRGNQLGWARVRVIVSDPEGGDPPSRTSGRWRLGAGEDFFGAAPVLPDAPRLDTGLTRILDVGPDRPSHSIQGTIAFDRPVTGEIQVDAALAHDVEGCDRPPITIGPEPRQTVRIRLDGLCRDAIYSFPTTVVDADGTEATFPGVFPLAGATEVLNVRWSFAAQVTAVHDGTSVALEGGNFAFDDKVARIDTPRCLLDGYYVTTPPNHVSHLNEDSIATPTFTVGGTFQLREGCGDPGAPAHTETWQVEVSTDLLELLFFADEPSQTLEVAVEGELIDYTVRVTIDRISRPTCRAGFCPARV